MEYLESFKQGKRAWDQWRNEHPDIRPDLSKVVGSSLELIELPWETYDLRRTILKRIKMDGGIFLCARLQGADLTDASLAGAYFWNARLTGACLHGAEIAEAVFSGAQLREADQWSQSTRHAQVDAASSFHS